ARGPGPRPALAGGRAPGRLARHPADRRVRCRFAARAHPLAAARERRGPRGESVLGRVRRRPDRRADECPSRVSHLGQRRPPGVHRRRHLPPGRPGRLPHDPRQSRAGRDRAPGHRPRRQVRRPRARRAL
ncbi:MAG: hypothetical protein AVDCRST_MAG10-3771, partial [uncultured Acidimicrobiales bacterium]